VPEGQLINSMPEEVAVVTCEMVAWRFGFDFR
jgi:hypothetical protein